MSFRFKAALCGVLAAISSSYSYAALDEVAQAVSDGDYGAALHALEAAPAGQRQSVEGQLLHAAALAGSGELEQAETQYKALIEQAPRLPEAYNNLAALYARQGRLDEARKLLEQAMRTNPSYATVYDNLSNIYLEMSRSAYAKALQIGKNKDGPSLQPIYNVNALQAASATPVVVASVEAPEPLPASDEASSPVETGQSAVTESEKTASEATEIPASSAVENGATDEQSGASSDVPAAQESEPAQKGAAEEAVMPEQPSPLEPTETPQETVASAETTTSLPEQAVAEAPVSDPVTAPKAPEQDIAVQPVDEVIATLKRWAADWAGQNVDGYLNTYDQSFQPGHGLTFEQWQAQRRKRLSKPEYIQVQLGDFDVKLQGSDRAIVDLVQHYSSNRYSDLTRKRIRLVRQPDGWKIVSEKTVEVL